MLRFLATEAFRFAATYTCNHLAFVLKLALYACPTWGIINMPTPSTSLSKGDGSVEDLVRYWPWCQRSSLPGEEAFILSAHN